MVLVRLGERRAVVADIGCMFDSLIDRSGQNDRGQTPRKR
jgi:hypothetical protein